MIENRKRQAERGTIKVPVGFEKLLFHAARDGEFKELLLSDPNAAIASSGIKLRPSEQAMLGAIGADALETMIASINPENPRRRKFMGLVAAAAASLAAGTVEVGCDRGVTKGSRPDTDEVETDQHHGDTGGVGPDTDVDGDVDSDTDADTDGDTDTDTDTD